MANFHVAKQLLGNLTYSLILKKNSVLMSQLNFSKNQAFYLISIKPMVYLTNCLQNTSSHLGLFSIEETIGLHFMVHTTLAIFLRSWLDKICLISKMNSYMNFRPISSIVTIAKRLKERWMIPMVVLEKLQRNSILKELERFIKVEVMHMLQMQFSLNWDLNWSHSGLKQNQKLKKGWMEKYTALVTLWISINISNNINIVPKKLNILTAQDT